MYVPVLRAVDLLFIEPNVIFFWYIGVEPNYIYDFWKNFFHS